MQKDPTAPRAAMCENLGVRGAFAFPVTVAGEVVAVLEFFAEGEMEEDPHLLIMTESVGEQVGRLIERRRADDKVREARDAAEAANQAKSRFLANMSHELRTPLNSVIGFANLLRKNTDGHLRPRDLSFLGRIAANGQHLLHLINQVLDLSKIEAGRTEVAHELVPLDRLIQETVSQLEGQIVSTRVKLLTEVPQAPMPVVTDPELLKQVLINLIGNAIKFTEEGHVIVRLGTDSSSRRPVWIEVEDTGVGIPVDRQAVIFDAFRQADDSTSRKYGGTGLGLTISLSLLKLLRCDLTLDSVPGRGSIFRIVLPQPEAVLTAGATDGSAAAPAWETPVVTR
jgi:signal transduction histidine kinase